MAHAVRAPLTLLITAAVLFATAVPARGADRDDAWNFVEGFPEDLALVAVLERPGVLLQSDDGRVASAVLASTGVFSATMDAWAALGRFLDADTDELISLFFSERVAVAVDTGAGFPQDPGAFINELDGRWTLVAQVNDDDVDRIGELLNPVPRRIVAGVPLYSIERGRFTLALVPTRPGTTQVVMAPKGAAATAERLIRAFKGLNQADPDRTTRPDATASPGVYVRALVPTPNGATNHVRAEIGKAAGEIELTFTAPAERNSPMGRAPTELLDSEREHALGVAVYAAGLTLEHPRYFGLARFDPQAADTSVGGPTFDPITNPTGVLLALHEHPERARTLEWSIAAAAPPGTLDAADADAWIASRYLEAGDAADGVSGIFPQAVRTQPVSPGRRADTGHFGATPPNVSWRTVRTSSGDRLVCSFADDPDRSAERAERLARAAELAGLLEDTPRQAPEDVVTKGWVDAGRLAGVLLANTRPELAPLAAALSRLTWEVRQDGTLARGRCTLTFTDLTDRPPRIGTSP